MQTKKQIETRTAHNAAQKIDSQNRAEIAYKLYMSGCSLGCACQSTKTHTSTFYKFIENNNIEFIIRKQTQSTEQKQKHVDFMNEFYKNPIERQKQSERMMGHEGSYLPGELNPNWKGISASYGHKHDYLRMKIGSATNCEVNSNHSANRYYWANLDHKYSRDPNDYCPLCQSCHMLYDLGKIKVRGLTLIERGILPSKIGRHKNILNVVVRMNNSMGLLKRIGISEASVTERLSRKDPTAKVLKRSVATIHASLEQPHVVIQSVREILSNPVAVDSFKCAVTP
jgi:hypothetical protein